MHEDVLIELQNIKKELEHVIEIISKYDHYKSDEIDAEKLEQIRYGHTIQQQHDIMTKVLEQIDN